MTASHSGEYEQVTITAQGDTATIRWFVVPESGWWVRWQASIEMTYPSGNVKVLWRRKFRSHTLAQTRAEQRMSEWAKGGYSGG